MVIAKVSKSVSYFKSYLRNMQKIEILTKKDFKIENLSSALKLNQIRLK